jgi:hypothetical protein
MKAENGAGSHKRIKELAVRFWRRQQFLYEILQMVYLKVE